MREQNTTDKQKKTPVYFLSDLHIKEDELQKQQNLISLLKTFSKDSVIYFLGDIFDYWVPHTEDHYLRFLKRLKTTLKDKTCYFIEGNRDFFFHNVARQLGISCLGKKCVLKINNFRILAMHGDMDLANDHTHSIYSRIVRSKLSFNLMNNLPKSISRGIARLVRSQSKGNKPSNNAPETGFLLKYIPHYDTVITGHFHLFTKRVFKYKGKIKTFIFLGEQTDRKLQYLEVIQDNNEINTRLSEFQT